MLLDFLKKDYSVEKQLFLVPKLSLRMIGFYPETEATVWLRLWALFNFVVLIYGCYAELYFAIYYLTIDVVSALDAFCPVATSIMSLFKVFYIWLYRSEFKSLIQRVRRLTEAQQSPEKLAVKRTNFSLATRLTALVWFFSFCVSMSFLIRPLFLNTLRYLDGKPFLYETPFKMIFPQALLSMPLYPITYIMVNWHGFITAFSFVGADGFFLCFCLYFATLLKALQLDLQETIANDSSSETELCQRLARIIERHNEIADMTTQMSAIMEEITLGHFVSSSIIIGTSVIDLMLFSGYGVVIYLVYTCAVLTELFLYCLGGTAVIESSAEVATTAYCSHWYLHSVRAQKMVLLVMVRAQRSLTIKVPFFAPSLPTLAAILRFTGSLIAVANSLL